MVLIPKGKCCISENPCRYIGYTDVVVEARFIPSNIYIRMHTYSCGAARVRNEQSYRK